jgi:catalase
MAEKKNTMTTTAGAPIADNQNSLTAGTRGASPAGEKGEVKKRCLQGE